MNNKILKLLIVVIVTLCGILIFECKKTNDLIGKTREDILILLEKYPRTDWNGLKKYSRKDS